MRSVGGVGAVGGLGRANAAAVGRQGTQGLGRAVAPTVMLDQDAAEVVGVEPDRDLAASYVELARRPGKRCLGPWGRSVNGGRPPGSAGQRTGAFGIQCLDGRTAPGFEMDG